MTAHDSERMINRRLRHHAAFVRRVAAEIVSTVGPISGRDYQLDEALKEVVAHLEAFWLLEGEEIDKSQVDLLSDEEFSAAALYALKANVIRLGNALDEAIAAEVAAKPLFFKPLAIVALAAGAAQFSRFKAIVERIETPPRTHV